MGGDAQCWMRRTMLSSTIRYEQCLDKCLERDKLICIINMTDDLRN